MHFVDYCNNIILLRGMHGCMLCKRRGITNKLVEVQAYIILNTKRD